MSLNVLFSSKMVALDKKAFNSSKNGGHNKDDDDDDEVLRNNPPYLVSLGSKVFNGKF